MPDFLADRQRTPPKLSGMPKSISIKEAMGALGGKLVIGGIPKSGNKDDPDPDRPEKPKTQAKVIAPVTEAIKNNPTPPASHETAEWGYNKYINRYYLFVF